MSKGGGILAGGKRPKHPDHAVIYLGNAEDKRKKHRERRQSYKCESLSRARSGAGRDSYVVSDPRPPLLRASARAKRGSGFRWQVFLVRGSQIC
jgi:hypothetical protein